MQGWLGNRDTMLHSGEGAISIARWAGKLVAWANDKGIKVKPGAASTLFLSKFCCTALMRSLAANGWK